MLRPDRDDPNADWPKRTPDTTRDLDMTFPWPPPRPVREEKTDDA